MYAMKNLLWFVIMALCGAVFTGIGAYARKLRKPMWFWSGSSVKEAEIADVPAYNRANGRMWIAFSLPFWLSAFLGIWCSTAAVVLTVANCLIGIPLLVAAYHRIYGRYRLQSGRTEQERGTGE